MVNLPSIHLVIKDALEVYLSARWDVVPNRHETSHEQGWQYDDKTRAKGSSHPVYVVHSVQCSEMAPTLSYHIIND